MWFPWPDFALNYILKPRGLQYRLSQLLNKENHKFP